MSNEIEQTAERKAKLDELTQLGVEAYPNRFDRTASVSDVVTSHGHRDSADLEASRPDTRTAGRILGMRSFGKANFLVLSDGLARIQVYVRADSLSEADFRVFSLLDLGDHIGVE